MSPAYREGVILFGLWAVLVTTCSRMLLRYMRAEDARGRIES